MLIIPKLITLRSPTFEIWGFAKFPATPESTPEKMGSNIFIVSS